MRILYLDCFAGMSGDMFLGALVDAGLNKNWLKAEIAGLEISGYKIQFSTKMHHGISGTKFDVRVAGHQHHRGFRDIKKIIEASSLSPSAKKRSVRIFQDLAEAEGKIHQKNPDTIHFHEIGAIDSIIDIVGTVIGLEKLGIVKIYASAIPLGSGFVKCQHGVLPVPAPATAELLKGVPVSPSEIKAELTTPTAAAILKNVVQDFGKMPAMKIEKIGYGAGTRDLEIPNFLRVFIGEQEAEETLDETVFVVEANIDNMNPEIYDYVSERLREQGCLEVYMTSVYMKKNRPGVLLSAITPKASLDSVMDVFFSETTTIGLRVSEVRRKKLDRKQMAVKTSFGTVMVKVSSADGKVKA